MPAPSLKCTSEGWLRLFDTLLLGLVFLFQMVVLNYILIYNFSGSFFTFLWFLGDFFSVVLFSFAIFIAHHFHRKRKIKEEREARMLARLNQPSGPNRSVTPPGSHDNSADECGFLLTNRWYSDAKLPVTYVSWLFYASLLIMKITVLFKYDIAQTLPKNQFLGPQLLKFCIGLSTIIFSLLLECHHSTVENDSLRRTYLNSISFGVALEILDSVSFLSLLIPTESRLMSSFELENWILALAAVNIMLPAVTIYKLSASNFGRIYHIHLETLYKVLHLLLVNLPYFALRIYLWRMFSMDTAIFLIKNVYAIFAFLREIYPDLKELKDTIETNRARKNLIANAAVSGSNPPRMLNMVQSVNPDTTGQAKQNGLSHEKKAAHGTESVVDATVMYKADHGINIASSAFDMPSTAAANTSNMGLVDRGPAIAASSSITLTPKKGAHDITNFFDGNGTK